MAPNPQPFAWVLEERLGRGAQASTWRARHAETGVVAAVKVFRLVDAPDWKAHELFLRECAALEALDHPAIPRLIEAHVDDEAGALYLVMELRDGRPLSTYLASGRTLSAGDLHDVLRQALDVLDYLHGRHPPVFHRDIKPANLLLDAHGRLSLVDFGGVRVALAPEGGSTVVGTFGYMAPEQLHGECGPRTDVFALGATMAALATGVDAQDLPRAGLEIDLSRVMPASPLRRVLQRMVRVDPAARLADAAAVREALDARALPPSLHRAAELAQHPPSGLLGWVWRVGLFVVWLTATLTNASLALIEQVLLPSSYRRKHHKIAHRYGDDPKRRAKHLAKLEARHARNVHAVRATRTNLRALADKSEPYPRPHHERLPRRGGRGRAGHPRPRSHPRGKR